MKRKTPTSATMAGGGSKIKGYAKSNNPGGQPNPRYSHSQTSQGGGEIQNSGRKNFKNTHKFFDSPSDRKVIKHTSPTKP